MLRINSIKGYEEVSDFYYVTTCGKIFSTFKNIFIKPYKTNTGYHRVTLNKGNNGKRIKISVHRIVGEAYLVNNKNLKTINHKNFNKIENHIFNIEWCSHSDNTKHYINGSDNKVHKGQAKLTDKQVLEILNKFNNLKEKKTRIAKEFCVDFNVIHKIIKGEGYQWVERVSMGTE